MELMTNAIRITAAILLCGAASSAQASCAGPGIPAIPEWLAPMKDSPSMLLRAFPRGGEGLTSSLISVVGRDRAGLKTVLGSLSGANAKQKYAIANALAQISMACVTRDPGLVRDVNQAAQRFTDPEMRMAFRAKTMPDAGPAAKPAAKAPETIVGGGGVPITGPLGNNDKVPDFPDPSAPIR